MLGGLSLKVQAVVLNVRILDFLPPFDDGGIRPKYTSAGVTLSRLSWHRWLL
jgi:hypothetical protein